MSACGNSVADSRPQLRESEVRALRDRVYGQVSTDNNWDACGKSWMQPGEVEFLQQYDRGRESAAGVEK